MAKKVDVDLIALILVLIGGLNIGLGVLGVDVLGKVYAAVGVPVVATVVNGAIGLSALLIAYKKWVK